jgi:predicted nucleic acid-binding protein
MRADFPAVLDACVLAPANLCDLLLSLAETPRLYPPLWSEEILEEVRRTQAEDLEWPPHLVELWQTNVRDAFPEAIITGYQNLISVCTNHEKDRHVLAVAIKAKAEIIVTANLRHFPPESLEPWGIRAIDPASYLINLYTLDPGVVVSRLESIARRRRLAPEVVLSRLGRSVPAFAEHVAEALGWQLPDA